MASVGCSTPLCPTRRIRSGRTGSWRKPMTVKSARVAVRRQSTSPGLENHTRPVGRSPTSVVPARTAPPPTARWDRIDVRSGCGGGSMGSQAAEPVALNHAAGAGGSIPIVPNASRPVPSTSHRRPIARRRSRVGRLRTSGPRRRYRRPPGPRHTESARRSIPGRRVPMTAHRTSTRREIRNTPCTPGIRAQRGRCQRVGGSGPMHPRRTRGPGCARTPRHRRRPRARR